MTRAATSFSYVLPVHNQETVLERSVQQLRETLRAHPGSEVLLIENGSSDGSAAVCDRLAAAAGEDAVPVRVARSATGLGHALRRGISLARGDVIVLTAADLPFGCSDLDAFLVLDPRPEVAIGSKAHPQSRTEIALQRRLMSEAFRWIRRLALGLRVRDSQGTIFVAAPLARSLQRHLACGDYLISTEVICWAIRAGSAPLEMPVVYPRSHASTVSPLRDSIRMLAGIAALRRRLRESPGTVLQHS